MRILVLSDIHSNLTALDAVLAHAEAPGALDRVWVLGDTVGYGPQPNECVEKVSGLGAVAVAGNHELALAGQVDVARFNPLAAEAIAWTAARLTAANLARLRALPLRAEDEGMSLVHGTPRDPAWEYLTTHAAAVENLGYFDTPGCAHGHTHVPVFVSVAGRRVTGGQMKHGQSAEFGAARFYLNPGSVGQPRDGDPRACYAVVDTDAGRATFHRAGYEVARTQRLMVSSGLPVWLAERLTVGR